MHFFIGPLKLFIQDTPMQWCCFELSTDRAALRVWENNCWSDPIPCADNTVFYTYSLLTKERAAWTINSPYARPSLASHIF